MHLKKKRYTSEERDDRTEDSTSFSYVGTNMADNTREVRIEEQLKVKIGDVKNLCSRSAANTSCSTQGVRDVFCTIALDQEEICRTPIIERTLSAFFQEEYQFKIPRRFRYLSVYVWDRDRHLKQVKPIGKVAIKREELHKYNHKDHWFPLRPVDANSEVQGMARIEVQFEQLPQIMQQERINLMHPDMTTHHRQAHQNDYKENSELSNIQRGSLKTRALMGLQANEPAVASWVQPTLMKHTSGTRLCISVPECVNLAKKNGTCDPFIIFTAYYSNARKVTQRTKVRKKTINPEFNEMVYFDLSIDGDASSTKSLLHHDTTSSSTTNSHKGSMVHPLCRADLCEIAVTIWHDSAGMADKVFLGEVKLSLRDVAVQPSAWYYLKPQSTSAASLSNSQILTQPQTRSCATPPGTRLSSDSTIGTLRLNLAYTADHVFPLATYDDLMNLLLVSVDQQPITVSAVSILGELGACKTDVVQPLVRIFMYKGRIVPIIRVLAEHEISNLTDPTTIFRGNTLVSKMMDEAMRLSGLHYLHQTLRPVVAQILAEKKPCEIDPTKVKDRSAVDTNLHNLEYYVERVFEAITKSAQRCPKVLCQIFHDLRELAVRYFPRNREVRYSVVSGFIFLRFFAAAILGPKLFGLTTEQLDDQTNRTLTLISKTIQSLGNLVSSRSLQQPFKEEYTGQLYKRFCTEKHVEAVKTFLEVISNAGEDPCLPGESNSLLPADGTIEPVLLKESMMTKYPQGRKRFGRRALKQRYFRLSTHSLSYAKAKDKQPICDIPLSDIQSVEKLNEKSFKMQNCFKIVLKDRTLIVQTTNCVEEQEWIDLLHKICDTNSIRMQYFHPSAFVNGLYSCCAASDENAPGCRNVSAQTMNNFQMDLVTALDPALDLQRIHTLIMSHMSELEAMLDKLVFAQLQKDRDQRNPLIPNAELLRQQRPSAYNEFLLTISQLRKVAYTIDKVHRNYKLGITRELKYGSRQAPIGDENYMQMVSAAQHLNRNQLPLHEQLQQLQQQHQQQQTTHSQQHSQAPPAVLPQMQRVMAYPYQQKNI